MAQNYALRPDLLYLTHILDFVSKPFKQPFFFYGETVCRLLRHSRVPIYYVCIPRDALMKLYDLLVATNQLAEDANVVMNEDNDYTADIAVRTFCSGAPLKMHLITSTMQYTPPLTAMNLLLRNGKELTTNISPCRSSQAYLFTCLSDAAQGILRFVDDQFWEGYDVHTQMDVLLTIRRACSDGFVFPSKIARPGHSLEPKTRVQSQDDGANSDNHDANEERCSICIAAFWLDSDHEEFQALQVVTLTCGHVFHTECLRKWLSTGRENEDGMHIDRKCPNCRAPIAVNLAASIPSRYYSKPSPLTHVPHMAQMSCGAPSPTTAD